MTRTSSATLVAKTASEQKTEKIIERDQSVATAEKAKNGLNRKPRTAARLTWEEVNAVTWRLTDPDAPKIEVPRSHGQWPGFLTPKAVAWVFDVGMAGNRDWRVRVRRRGGWQAFGSIADAETAKRMARAAIAA